MSTTFGHTGAGALGEAARRAIVPTIAGVLAGVALAAAMVRALADWGPTVWGPLIPVVFIVTPVVVLLLTRSGRNLLHEGRIWASGAGGDYAVHEQLRLLPDDHAVFHDFHPVPSDAGAEEWDVDHIVVGPTGVFAIDTRDYANQVIKPGPGDRWHADDLAEVKRHALALQEAIAEWTDGDVSGVLVVPVLVYSHPGTFVEETREDNVHVIPLRWLDSEVERYGEQAIDLDTAGRIAVALYSRMPEQLRDAAVAEIRRYGKLSKGDRDRRRGEGAGGETAE